MHAFTLRGVVAGVQDSIDSVHQGFAMKAATLSKQCKSAKGHKAPYANSRRDAGAHLPKRHAVMAGYTAPDSDDAALPLSLHDAPQHITLFQPAADLSIPRVLLVDRDLDTAAALTTLLVPEATLVYAGSCAEARRLLDTQLFSMVIIDPSLPDGDGASVINALHHTPVLVYSAREPLKHDKLPYLSKPYTTPRELWSTISRLLGIGGLLASED
jgi:CheY-like chemotaxis protein